MKKTFTKVIAVLLTLAMMLSLTATVFAAEDYSTPSDKRLKFNDNGKFRIMQIADTQDDAFAAPGMLQMIEKALEKYKPDLVVFTGDNTSTLDLEIEVAPALKRILSIVDNANIPFTLVFGNHDAENVSRESHFKAWRSYKNCLVYDSDPDTYGMGNHNLTIKASKGEKVVYNLWFFDSHVEGHPEGYDYIRQDQLDWYTNASNELKAQNGGEPVPAMAFQHIIPYEINEYILTSDKDMGNGFWDGEAYKYLDPAYAEKGSILQEYPCPSFKNSGQMAAFAAQGDVNAVFVGHDHVNDYVVHTKLNAADGKSIDLVNTPGASFQSYGNDNVRGLRVIDLDEKDLWNYKTETYTFFDVMGDTEEMRMLSYFSDQIGWWYVAKVIEIIPEVGPALAQGFLKLVYMIATK